LFEIFKRVISHKWAWSFLYKTFCSFFLTIKFINLPLRCRSDKGLQVSIALNVDSKAEKDVGM
jgi:hypothetical protein